MMQANVEFQTLEELLDDSYQALEREELKKARNLHRKACELNAKNRDVRILEIDLLEAEDALEEAAAACDALAEDFPEDPLVLFRLATSLLEAYDDTENATLILEELLKDIIEQQNSGKKISEEDEMELTSFLFEIYLTLINCYHSLDKNDQALEIAEAALKIFPDDPIAKMGLATTYFERREFQKSVDTLKELLEHHAHFADAYFMRARAYLALGQNEKADKEFNRAHQTSPIEFPQIQYYENNRFKKWCEECLKKLPNNLGNIINGILLSIQSIPADSLNISPSSFAYLECTKGKKKTLYIFQKNIEISVADEHELKNILKESIVDEISKELCDD